MTPNLKKKFTDLGFGDEALAKLNRYAELIAQWNKAINLVAPASLPQLWERHLLDSAQLWPLISELENKTIIDLGSGGGLPGIVMAIAGANVTMIESDARKCVFLREVSRETSLTTNVVTERIEKAKPQQAPIITARALAPLKQLIEWATPFLEPNGQMIFLKGADVANEISELPKDIQDKIELKQSVTDKFAKIVIIK